MTQIDFPHLASAQRTNAPADGGPPPELLFERLLPRYERRFGAMPPVSSAPVEEVNRLMRCALADAARQPAAEASRRC